MKQVIAVDTSGIQGYVFHSNRLRENVGASHLVRQATETWADEILDELEIKHLKIYAGGGNYVCEFTDAETAKEFKRRLSRRVLEYAPGLQVVFGKAEYKESLYQTVRQAFADLSYQKQCRALPSPLLGLSVNRVCASTGFPAVTTRSWIPGEDAQPVSAEVAAKLDAVDSANREMQDLFEKEIRDTNFIFPTQLDHINGANSDESLIAVVHADGNGMGKIIQELSNEYKDSDSLYRSAISEFSENIKRATRDALGEALSLLLANIKKDFEILLNNASGEERSALKLHKDDKTKKYFLPFRPIVVGGDDVTFVCDARIGLSLAVAYLNAFEVQTEKHCGTTYTACAGVAMVKTHYPFAEAYNLAETLTESAKGYRHELVEDVACLDWHLAMQGISTTLGAAREREYQVKAGNLTQRPVIVGNENTTSVRSWTSVEKALRGFATDWSREHNKVKQLREELRGGELAVRSFLHKINNADQNNKKQLPDLGQTDDSEQSGWAGDTCAYYDAIELEDRLILLENKMTTSRQSPQGVI